MDWPWKSAVGADLGFGQQKSAIPNAGRRGFGQQKSVFPEVDARPG
jgi:hypothetical protein